MSKTIETKIKETMDNVMNDINDFSIDDLKSNGFTIRSGNKILKMTVQEDCDNTSIEDEILNELRDKLSERLLNIGAKIKGKLDEMSTFVSTVKNEYESKKRDLDKKINSSNIMPDITYEHTQKGLSLTKGYDGTLLWLVQSVYWPKYIDDRVIDPKYSKRLVNHVILTIETSGNKVMNVGVRKPIGLGTFNHYHRECWGQWSPPREWKTPDDILDIAHQAEVVLETINTGSLADHSPRGLMRVSTLRKHSTLRDDGGNTLDFESNKRSDQMGINDNFVRDDIWSVR